MQKTEALKSQVLENANTGKISIEMKSGHYAGMENASRHTEECQNAERVKCRTPAGRMPKRNEDRQTNCATII